MPQPIIKKIFIKKVNIQPGTPLAEGFRHRGNGYVTIAIYNDNRIVAYLSPHYFRYDYNDIIKYPVDYYHRWGDSHYKRYQDAVIKSGLVDRYLT